MTFPLQPIHTDPSGVVRFQANVLVDALYQHSSRRGLSLNDLSGRFPPDQYQAHWEQLAQLIGYSLSGFSSLSYTSPETVGTAQARADNPHLCEVDARLGLLRDDLQRLRQELRGPIARLYYIHPDDLWAAQKAPPPSEAYVPVVHPDKNEDAEYQPGPNDRIVMQRNISTVKIRVKLNAQGRNILRTYLEGIPRPFVHFASPDNWTEFTLWEFANIFGSYLTPGVFLPFEAEIQLVVSP